MNNVNLIGRLVRDPETKYPEADGQVAVTHYTLAINRYSKDINEVAYVRCVAFGKAAEFAEKYFRQGMRVTICGRIQTGSYTNRDGVKVYTTEVVVEEQEFAESKSNGHQNSSVSASVTGGDGFANIPDGIDEEAAVDSLVKLVESGFTD